jgi:hypothetical protein
MFVAIIAVCFAADVNGLPVNKCYMRQSDESFKSLAICEAWSYRNEESMFRAMTLESTEPVVINIVCRTADKEQT